MAALCRYYGLFGNHGRSGGYAGHTGDRRVGKGAPSARLGRGSHQCAGFRQSLVFVGGSGEEEGVVDNGDTDIDIGLLKYKEDLGSTETGKARVFVEDARLRAEPSKEAEELTQLAEGTTVEVVALEGEWYRTKFGIMDGFVHQSCLFVIVDD